MWCDQDWENYQEFTSLGGLLATLTETNDQIVEILICQGNPAIKMMNCSSNHSWVSWHKSLSVRFQEQETQELCFKQENASRSWTSIFKEITRYHSGSHTSPGERESAIARIFTQYLREINLKSLHTDDFCKILLKYENSH